MFNWNIRINLPISRTRNLESSPSIMLERHWGYSNNSDWIITQSQETDEHGRYCISHLYTGLSAITNLKEMEARRLLKKFANFPLVITDRDSITDEIYASVRKFINEVTND